jgi:2-keto-3-deoxy-L-rhamnonate aldolase RhmA
MIFQNRVKRALREGKIVFGPMVSEVRAPGIAVLFARAGFDLFFIDMEHSCFTTETMADMILASRASGICPIVRVPSRLSHDHMSRPLDSGAQGLLIPQIESRDEVENITRWCRYYPAGDRGLALTRMHTFFESGDTPQTMRDLNEELLLCVQIESRKAIENLPDILSVPGVDVALVGPGDLSQSLGDPGNTDNPEHVRACRSVIEMARQHGVVPGIYVGSLENARRWMEEGMRLIGFSSDIRLILEISRQYARKLREISEEVVSSGK